MREAAKPSRKVFVSQSHEHKRTKTMSTPIEYKGHRISVELIAFGSRVGYVGVIDDWQNSTWSYYSATHAVEEAKALVDAEETSHKQGTCLR